MCTFEILYWCLGLLRPWAVCLSRQASLQVFLLHSRGGWSHRIRCHLHQGCYEIRSICNLSFFQILCKWPFKIDDWVHNGSPHISFLLGNSHAEWLLLKKKALNYLCNLQIGGSTLTIEVLVYCWGVVFVILSKSVKFEILWASNNLFSSIIILTTIFYSTYN